MMHRVAWRALAFLSLTVISSGVYAIPYLLIE
jgi:hypothetical protein